MARKAAVSGTARPALSPAEGRSAKARWVEIKCAFCGGKGKDPSRVLSPLSNCGVCGGKGTVRVEDPYETCSACLDAGAYYRSRLSCGDCSGEDAVTVKQEEEA